ncbi:MAG: thiamine diphosphokinase [Fimbriimonadaceae bacterium]|nr:thiamine diphosphokinase [Fimbriimonadaceae bacterium]
MTKALGVLAGQDMPDDLLMKWASSADLLFAADGGVNRLHKIGIKPTVVIGDMDSAEGGPLAEALAEVIHLPGQEVTDCDKLLEYVEAQGHSAITLAAVEGDRMDHMLATLHSAARSGLSIRLALRTGIGWVLRAGDEVDLATRVGRQVSLLPLTAVESCSFRGVEWPLEKSPLSPLGPTSISNRAVTEHVHVHLIDGAAAVFLEVPPEELPQW